MEDSVIDLAREVDTSVEAKDIDAIKGGYSSLAYKINTTRPFVILVERPGSVSAGNYGQAFVVLSLLKQKGYKYSPEPIWLKSDHKAIAMDFFDGLSSGKFDFAGNDVDPKDASLRVIDALIDTTSITYEEYEREARKNNVEPMPLESRLYAAEIYGVERFKIAEKYCPDTVFVEWLRPRVDFCLNEAKKEKIGNRMFGHSDPSNPNILFKTDGSFMIIDWESARFHTSGPEFFVAYTTKLVDFMKPFKTELIAHVSEKIGMSRDEFAQKVRESGRITGIYDVVWSAMMMGKVAHGEVERDIEEFRELTQERIASYETEFGSG